MEYKKIFSKYEETRTVAEVSEMSFIGNIRPDNTSTPKVSKHCSKQNESARDLEMDCTYITDRLIAMSFEANGCDRAYRNSLVEIINSLKVRHDDRYKIFNVSERRYDMLELSDDGSVEDFAWPNHLAPTLKRLHQIISAIHKWLSLSHKNIAIIHCKGGLNRLGVVISAYVQYSKDIQSPEGAMNWFALRKYFETKLKTSLLPSQQRYVKYFGKICEKKLEISHRIFMLRNFAIYGIPHYGNGHGFDFLMKIYQGYMLKHTTKTHRIPSLSRQYCICFEDGIPVNGDIMVKCLKIDAVSQRLLFRLQFNTSAIKDYIATFGKYELDEADKDPYFPDSTFIELVFTNMDSSTRDCTPKNGIFGTERNMATVFQKSDNGHPYHVAGPLNGNPYAQINNNLKDRLRSRPTPQTYNNNSLNQGIEDLDDILGDLGFVSKEPDINANTHVKINSQSSSSEKYFPNTDNSSSNTSFQYSSSFHNRLYNKPSTGEVKYAPVNSQRRVSLEQHGRLHKAPTLHYRPNPIKPSNNDDVFRETILQTNVNDLLKELDASPLNYKNNAIVGKRKSSKPNLSSYDNDGSISENESLKDSEDGAGTMVIQAGTVAQHVESLSKVLFNEDNLYNKKMGVPLAGLASPKLVEEKVTEFNSRSLARGFCSQPMELVYHSQGGPTRINYEGSSDEIDGKDEPSLRLDAPPSFMKKSLQESLEENQLILEQQKRESDPIVSDSAYGESMSSSSSVASPAYTKPHYQDGSSVNFDSSAQLHANIVYHNEDDNHSTRSENNHAKSSGIGSRSSSMNSLEYESDSIEQMKVKSYHPSEVMEPILTESVKTDEPLDFSKKRSLSIVEEKVQSITIQREVEFMNDDIFKNLFEDDQKSVDSVRIVSRIPIEEKCSSFEVQNRNNVNDKKNPLLNQYNAPDFYQAPRQPNGDITENKHIHSTKLNGYPVQLEEQISRREITHLENAATHDLPPSENENIERKLEYSPSVEYRQGIKFENGIISPSEDLQTHGNFFKNHSLPNGSIHKHLFESQIQATNDVTPPLNSTMNETIGATSAFQFPTVVEVENQRRISHDSSVNSDEQSSPRSPKSPRSGNQTLRVRRMRSSGSSNSSISSSELFHEVARYPSVKFDKDTMNLWYKPNISRDEATNLLKDREPGSFVVRDSQSYDGAFGLAVKVETPPIGVLQQVGGDISKIDLENELVRHFLIEPSKKGVRLKGSNNEPAFPSLVALIYQHTLTKMALPVTLVIPEPENKELRKSNLTESQLLQKGAACNLIYLGTVDVESLTGDGALHYAVNKITSQTNIQQKTTVVSIKVNQQGITLTDNQRKLFFRKHYYMRDVLHCGVDPKGRKINMKALVENVDKEVGCFGFVVRKHSSSLENECHLMAELDADQPASAVINFIHKAMRYALHV